MPVLRRVDSQQELWHCRSTRSFCRGAPWWLLQTLILNCVFFMLRVHQSVLLNGRSSCKSLHYLDIWNNIDKKEKKHRTQLLIYCLLKKIWKNPPLKLAVKTWILILWISIIWMSIGFDNYWCFFTGEGTLCGRQVLNVKLDIC